MLSIRRATSNDAALLTSLIHELAEYEQVSHEAIVTEEDVTRDAFGAHPKFRALIAEGNGEGAGAPHRAPLIEHADKCIADASGVFRNEQPPSELIARQHRHRLRNGSHLGGGCSGHGGQAKWARAPTPSRDVESVGTVSACSRPPSIRAKARPLRMSCSSLAR